MSHDNKTMILLDLAIGIGFAQTVTWWSIPVPQRLISTGGCVQSRNHDVLQAKTMHDSRLWIRRYGHRVVT